MESIVGLFIFTIVALAAAQFMRWHVNPLLLTERQEKAGKQAEAVLNELAAKPRASLPEGGSFNVNAAGEPSRNSDDTVTLNCTPAYCDQIIAVPQSSGTALDFVRADWGATLPANSTQVYVRAWTVATLDAARGRRRITIAIFPSDSGLPLSSRRTEVVQK